MVASAIVFHHREATFRLELVGVLLDELDQDMAALGFPNARRVLALGRAAVADATIVGRALDDAINRREIAAEAVSGAPVGPAGEVPMAQARAEYRAPANDPADESIDYTNVQAFGSIDDATAELESEGQP